jgi:Dockerin type I domain
MICAQAKSALASVAGFSAFLIVRIVAWSTRNLKGLTTRPWDLRRKGLVASLVASFAVAASPCWAITLGHVDNFNDGTTQGWRVGSPGDFPVNEPNIGQSGVGDHALWMATAPAGTVSNLLVFNTSSNWTGNWMAAGVSRIELDARDPGSNNFPLAIRLGIAGPGGGPSTGGGGDTYVTEAMPVPSDGQWHRLAFDVSPSSFFSTGGSNIDRALADVRHFRILHNPAQSFTGATTIGGGEFYLDNIQALSAIEPPSTTGDYNGNGVVDAADYVVWRKTLNQTVPEPGDGADGDRSGVIDQGDYEFWRMQFGDVVPVPVSGSGHIATVPEPATSGLLLFATLVALGHWPRKRFQDFHRVEGL